MSLPLPPFEVGYTPRFLAYRVWPMSVAVAWTVFAIFGGATGSIDEPMFIIALIAAVAAVVHAVFPLLTTARYSSLFMTIIAGTHRITDLILDETVARSRTASIAAIWALVVLAKVVIFWLTMPLVEYDRVKNGAG